MPRRLGASVPQTVSRLLQGGVLPSPPAWYEAVGSLAPLRPSITRRIPTISLEGGDAGDASKSRNKGKGKEDLSSLEWRGSRRLAGKSSKLRPRPGKPGPLPGFELYDRVRRMFYDDHPFEAFRGTNLVESETVVADHAKPGPRGSEWQELSERSRNPSPEDTVDFIVNLHEVHGIPLALAYSAGISQFQSLRATHEIATLSAQAEMRSHGFTWPTEFSDIDRLERAEDNHLTAIARERSGKGAGAGPAAESSPSSISTSSSTIKLQLLDGAPSSSLARGGAGGGGGNSWSRAIEYLGR